MDPLGHVDQGEVGGECLRDLGRSRGVEAGEEVVQGHFGAFAVLTSRARRKAGPLDDLEEFVAALFAQYLTEEGAKKTDVPPQAIDRFNGW